MKIFSKIQAFRRFAQRFPILAFVCAIVLSLSSAASTYAQHSQMEFKQITQEEGRAILLEFRKFRFPADYCMDFEIVHKPRKSDEETVYVGTLWATWNNDGALSRMELRATGEPPEKSRKFLIQSGKNPELWTLGENGSVEKIDSKSTAPFFEGLIFTPFEVQAPFLFWEIFSYETTKRSRGRPVHFFKMVPPENFKADNPGIGFIRIGIDRAYNVLMSAESYANDGAKLKNFYVGSVKKIQDLYTFKELELRDERSRDRDTFRVKKAAMRLKFDRELFAPKNLTQEMPKIPDGFFEKVE